MSIETLHENIARAAQGGQLLLNAAVFREANLEAPPDLDALLQKAFAEFDLTGALLIETSPEDIGPIQDGSYFEMTGTISVRIARDKPVRIKFAAAGPQGLLVIAISLGNTWNFGQSFLALRGKLFDELHAREPYFFFAGQPESAYPWLGSVVALEPGLNFAGSIELDGYLAAAVELLSEFRPQPAYTLSGTVNPSQVAPVAPGAQLNYPGLKLITPPMTDETFELGFLTIGAPYIWVTLIDYGEEIGLAPAVMLAAHLNIPGNETPVAFRAILPANSATKLVAFDLVALERSGLVLTADQIFALMAGQTWYAVVPPALSTYLQGFGFRSFGAYVSYGNGLPSVSDIEVVIASTLWRVLDNPLLEFAFELDWTIRSPLQDDQSQFAELYATASFMPDLFPGKFEFSINTELIVTGEYVARYASEQVSFNRLVAAVTGGAIKIPQQFVSILFDEFFVTVNQPARFYSLAATTSIRLPLLGAGKFELNGVVLRLSVQRPQAAADDGTRYSGSIRGNLIVGSHYLLAEGSYAADVWTFKVAMQPGTDLRFQDLIDAIFDTVQLPADIFRLDVSLSDVAIQAVVPTVANSATSYSASGTIRWRFQILSQQIDTTAKVSLAYNSQAVPTHFTGSVTATTIFSIFGIGAKFTIGYEIKNEPGTPAPSRAIFLTWQGLTARYVQGSGQQVLEFTADSTWNMGRLIKALVRLVSPSSNRELPPPWDLLNSISLDGLKISFNLNTKAVTVSWPLHAELFFGTIQSLSITKDQSGKVEVTLTGNFAFNNSTQVRWDAATSDPPEVPGGGNSAFDLRLLALGQRVTVPDLAAIQTVGDAVEQLKSFTEPTPDSRVLPIGPGTASPATGAALASPLFSPASNWLVGTHFYALSSTLELKLIFNDPVLYGLRIGLAGPKAKIFAGLEFEILYQKISDSVGVYKIMLKLPDAMRYLQFGAVTVILPVVSVEIYTNGSFKVDFGFPYNMDFSVSFTVQVFPFTGSGGFYFGLLDQNTSSQFPQNTPCGNFTPVVEFGFGMQVGLGKSLSYGILSAQVSITVFGILEGVVATWRAYDNSDLMIAGTDGQPLLFGPESREPFAATAATPNAESDYYYKLTGTVGVIGRFVGVVDFAIIKAELNLVVQAYIQGTFEAYRKTIVTLEAGVTISLTFTIDCGLFVISFDLSFSAQIRESFTIGNDRLSEAPWYCGGATPLPPTIAPPSMPLLEAVQMFAINPNFNPLQTPTVGQRTLDIFFLPHLSVAGEGASSRANQDAVYSINLFISNEQRTQGGDTYRSFERLMRDTYLWIVSSFSGQSQKGTPAQELLKTVQLAQLEAALAYLSVNSDGLALDYDDITDNLAALFRFNIQLPPQSMSTECGVKATAFPMPNELDLKATYLGATVADVEFDKWTKAQHDYVEDLQERINKLIVQMLDELQSENEENENAAVRALVRQQPPLPDDLAAEKSLAAFVFVDYFALAAQYLVQAAIDAFKNYAYPLENGDSISSVRQKINAMGGGSQNHLTDEQIARSNREHSLTANLLLTLNGVPYPIQDGDTWGSIAGQRALQPGQMAADNAAVEQVLITGLPLTINQVTKTVPNDGSIASTAAEFGMTPSQFGEAIANLPDVLQPLTIITLNGLKHTTTASGDPDTIMRLTELYGIDVPTLLPSLAGVANLFNRQTQATIILPGLRALTNAELWNDITSHHGITHLSGLAARYLLNGLRLPVEGIRFKDHNHHCTMQETCGLQHIIGQQFSLPSLQNYNPANPLTITLRFRHSVSWITFTNPVNPNDSSELSFNLPSEAASQVNALIAHARAQGLQAPIEKPHALRLVETRPRQYTFRSNIILQTATRLPLPNDNLPQGTTPRPLIWNFPVALLAELSRTVALDPRFLIEIGSTDSEGGRVIPRPAQAYGFATLINAAIKRVVLSEADAPVLATTYEFVGADELGINLLERLLSVITPDDISIINNIYILYQPNQTSDRADGLQYDGEQNYATFIVQANLSNETNPPSSPTLAGGETPPRGLLNGFYQFLSQLWAGSIVRSGGHYFSYELADGNGLPESLFDEDGLANISVLVIYNSIGGVSGPDGGILRNFMNAAVINDPVDKSGDVVYLKSMPRAASATVQSDISLADIAAAHHLGVIEIAAANPAHPLSTDALLQITDIVHQVKRGETLAQIAAYFGKSEQQIINENPHVNFASLTPGTGLHIPDLTTNPHAGAPGLTLQSIADYYDSTLASLAWANREVKGLYTSAQPLTFHDMLLDKESTLPPGNVGLVVTRQNPGADQTQPAVYLEQQYNMLGYDLTTNTDFIAIDDALALPSTPTEDAGEEAVAQLKMAAPRAASTEAPWVYTFTVPASRAARNNPVPASTSQQPYPERTMNPYAGVGGFVQLSLDWRDMMGNHTWSRFDDSSHGNDYPLNNAPSRVGFTDDIIGLGQWASTNFDHYFERSQSGPQLVIEWSFDPSRYAREQPPVENGDMPTWERNAKADRQLFANIYYQLAQTDRAANVATLLETVTSLAGDQPQAITSAQATAVRNYALAAWRYVVKLLDNDGQPPPISSLPAPVKLTRAINASTIGTITEIKVAFQMRRVNPTILADFRDEEASRLATTLIGPRLLKSAQPGSPNPGYTLDWYAAQFQAAFDEQTFALRLATGVSRSDVGAGQRRDTLWAVRFGKSNNQPYYYRLNKPAMFFAPAPLSTTLINRPDLMLYTFTPSGGLSQEPDARQSFTGIDLDVWGRTVLDAIDQLLAPQYAVTAFLVDSKGKTNYLQQVLDTKYKLAGAIVEGVTNILCRPRLDPATNNSNFAAAREKLRQQLLIKLGNAYSVDAIVQYEMTVNAPPPPADDRMLPRLYSNLVAPNPSIAETDYAAGSFKIPLKNGTSLLTYAFRARDTRRQASFPLVLQYVPTHIEHQLASVPGIPNYQASSWLNFVTTLPPIALADGANPPVTQIDIDIPIPLRAYPTPPSLQNQTFLHESDDQSATTTLEKAKQWTFRFIYSQVHAAQDRIDSVVRFNVPQQTGLQAAAQETVDLVTMLARIIHVLAQIEAVFEADMLKVKLDTPASSPNFSQAQNALSAFATLTAGLDDKWRQWVEQSAVNASLSAGGVNENLPFSISEDFVDKEVTLPGGSIEMLRVLRVTIAFPTDLLPGMRNPPIITFEGYAPVEVEPEETSPPVAAGERRRADVRTALARMMSESDCDAPPDDQISRRAWLYMKLAPQTGEPPYLLWEQALEIAERRLDITELDVIRYQNAWANVRIIRNLDLVGSDNPTREPFVYRTPIVQFRNVLTPLLDTSREINIAEVPTGTAERRLMAEHLTALFETFFKGSPSQQQLVKIEARYAYALSSADDAPVIELPLLLLPPTEFPIPPDWKNLTTVAPPTGASTKSFIETLAEQLQTWFNNHKPSPQGGQFRLDLSAFSSLSNNTQPLVRIRNLTLMLEHLIDIQ